MASPSFGEAFVNAPEVVAEGLALTVRCPGKDCRRALLQYTGVGTVRLSIPCPDCGAYVMVKGDMIAGVTVFRMPKPRSRDAG